MTLQPKPGAQRAASPARYEASHPAMGTVFTLVAYGPDLPGLRRIADLAFQEIDRLDDELSHYKPQSELSVVNREAWRRPVAVNPELFKLVEESVRYGKESAGAFDVTVGPLMKAWGFFRGWGRLPSASELAESLAQTGYRHVMLDASARTIRFAKPGIEIDLGAIGKGYAVDQVVKILRAEGITQALISSGSSSIYALGSPPGEAGWRVAVCNPFNRRMTAAVLRLQNLSLSVSGDYEKFFEIGGEVYAHIMDPRTGLSARNMLMAVVVSSQAVDSDALSTFFFVEGVERSREYLERHPNRAAIFYGPGPSRHSFQQTVVRSREMDLPSGSLMEFESP